MPPSCSSLSLPQVLLSSLAPKIGQWPPRLLPEEDQRGHRQGDGQGVEGSPSRTTVNYQAKVAVVLFTVVLVIKALK